jgi:chromosome transmission fidelity protein 1
MVGLPFPNSKDPVLVEKMAYISQKNGVGKPQLSQQYYENLCMKAVNQSIGRSIRHVNDYASILLVDARFKKPSIQSKLPQWISKRTTIATTFSEGFGAVSSFFRGKRPLQAELEAQRQKKSVST